MSEPDDLRPAPAADGPGLDDAFAGVPGGDPYEWWRRGIELLERGDAAAAAMLLELAPDSHYGHFGLGLSLTGWTSSSGRSSTWPWPP